MVTLQAVPAPIPRTFILRHKRPSCNRVILGRDCGRRLGRRWQGERYRMEKLGDGVASHKSVPKVSPAGDNHRDAVLVAGGDHFDIAPRAARLDDCGNAGLGGAVN